MFGSLLLYNLTYRVEPLLTVPKLSPLGTTLETSILGLFPSWPYRSSPSVVLSAVPSTAFFTVGADGSIAKNTLLVIVPGANTVLVVLLTFAISFPAFLKSTWIPAV